MARYSDQGRRAGELSAPEAAERLGLTPATLCRWGRDALEGFESRMERADVRRDVAGRYWFSAEAVIRISQLQERVG